MRNIVDDWLSPSILPKSLNTPVAVHTHTHTHTHTTHAPTYLIAVDNFGEQKKRKGNLLTNLG